MTAFRPLAAAALAVSMALAVPAAFAQSKKELVAKVLQLQQPGIEGLGNLLASNTANQVLQVVGRAMPGVPQDKREAVAKDAQNEVRKFYEDVAPQLRAAAVKLAPETVGALYEERFSEDELKQLIAWLESPVNKKFQQVANEMQQNLSKKLVAETKGTIEPKIKALEKTLSDRFNAASAAKPAAAPASGRK